MIWAVVMMFISGNTVQQTPQLSQLRRLYSLAAVQRQGADSLSGLVANVTATNAPVIICYKGASKMMQAKYAVNPINKFSLFKSGKDLIENAVSADTTNIEMRYLRLSIQSNLPAILGYNADIATDRRYLEAKVLTEKDTELKEIIGDYLSKLK